jgi:hypothetical protein
LRGPRRGLKDPEVLAWVARHPPFFSAVTRRRLKRGTLRSIVELQAAIHRYLAEHNDEPRPLVWIQPADQILDMNR